jgi:hypothetical protein
MRSTLSHLIFPAFHCRAEIRILSLQSYGRVFASVLRYLWLEPLIHGRSSLLVWWSVDLPTWLSKSRFPARATKAHVVSSQVLAVSGVAFLTLITVKVLRSRHLCTSKNCHSGTIPLACNYSLEPGMLRLYPSNGRSAVGLTLIECTIKGLCCGSSSFVST